VKKRNKKRFDLSSCKKQVEGLSSKIGSRYQRKVVKMQKAEATFAKLNDDLMDLFQDYVNFREQILNHYTHYVIDMQVGLFADAAETSRELPKVIREFKKLATGAPQHVEMRIRQMMTNLRELEAKLSDDKNTSHHSPLASTSDKKEKYRIHQLLLHDNPTFDTSETFERRHRLMAPTQEEYEASINHNYEIAVYSHSANSSEELSFKAGDLIEVLEIREDGWWVGLLNGSKGTFPCNYTQPNVL